LKAWKSMLRPSRRVSFGSKKKANQVFNLTYLGVTDLAFASSAPPKTQVKTALGRQKK